MAFRIKIADPVRAQVAALRAGWRALLVHRLKELAELAEVHPISHAHPGPVPLQTAIERLRVGYQVDRDQRLLTVTELRAEAESGSEQEPGASVA